MVHPLLRPYTCCEVRYYRALFPTHVLDKTLDLFYGRKGIDHLGSETCLKVITIEAVTRATSKHPPF